MKLGSLQPTWQTADGSVRLFLGDCIEVLPTLEEGSVDAVVTDPPYGIGYEHRRVTSGKWVTKHHNTPIIGDDSPFDPGPWLKFREVVPWGAPHFSKRLPDGGWLVWDKRRGIEDVQFSMSDGEAAWTNTTPSLRIFRHLWFGLARDSEIGEHYHPTQKPIALMEWCLSYVKGSQICDPFMGSGTTGVACVRTGRRFIGIEKEKKYFDIAVKRITDELNRAPLFEPPPVVQRTLLEDSA